MKHAPKRASSSGAVGCGGRHPAVTKRQKRETDEIFASLTLDGTEVREKLILARVQRHVRPKRQPSSRLFFESADYE